MRGRRQRVRGNGDALVPAGNRGLPTCTAVLGVGRLAHEAGASAYALKTEPIVALVEVIDLVLRGAAFVSNTFRRGESAAAQCSARVDLDALSAREREVLRLLAEGRRTQEIADLLGLGVKSVETYRSRLMEKLGIDNVAGLVRFAIRAGIIAPEV